jgi:hypothetical protein
MLDKQMRLEELLGREVTIRWFEGVTLIQAVCRQLLAHDGRHDAFPTAAEILLAADGTVATTHASGRTAVRTAAQLLGRMLSEDVPVRLRLIVAQATGADTAYPTLDEFSAALAYFERPDSNQVLRALFERAMAAPARATAAAEAAAAPVALPEQEYQDQSRNRTHLRLVVGAAVTAACVLAAWLGASAVDYSRLGVAFTSLAGSGSSGGSREPAASRTKSAGVGTAGGAASDARRGSARTPEHSATRTSARPAAKPPAAERVAARVTAERSASRKDPLQVAALLPLAMSSSPIAPAAEYRPVFGETVEVTASEASPEDEVAANGARIFTRADVGVVPPRSVYPKLPSDSQNPSEPDTRTVLELVIGTNGLVERAKLRSIPRDIHEFMLVSAAKAWIFEPATIDGAAVRYRHQVRIMLP